MRFKKNIFIENVCEQKDLFDFKSLIHKYTICYVTK